MSSAILAVFGATGAGKSSFLNAVSASNTHPVGHTLSSKTQDISSYLAIIDGKSCDLIDTPGFDDTNRSNVELLEEMAESLRKMYTEKRTLSGIFFFHRITDNRVGGSGVKMLRIFEAIVGPHAMKNVVLVTTMWDLVDSVTGERREKQLKDNFWGNMIQNGAKTARHDGSPGSALAIAELLLKRPQPIALALQEELVTARLSLHETAAGKALHAEISDTIALHAAELEKIRAEIAEIANADPALREQLQQLRDELRQENDQMKNLNAEKRRLEHGPAKDGERSPAKDGDSILKMLGCIRDVYAE